MSEYRVEHGGHVVTDKEGHCMSIFSTVEILSDVIKENEKLKKCLQFYALFSNWKDGAITLSDRCGFNNSFGGKRAREVLCD